MKVLSVFEDKEVIIDKGLAGMSDQFRKLPRFVSDYLIAKFVDSADPGPGLQKIESLMRNHYVESEQKEWIKSRIKELGRYNLLGDIRVRYDETRDEYFAYLSAIQNQYIRVSPHVIAEYGEILLTSGAWGTITIAFDANCVINRTIHPFFVTDFTPFQVTDIDVDHYVESREKFETDEWIDLLITTLGFNPEPLSNEEKMLYMVRMIPFIQSNLNMVELGPSATGKTFAYRQLSSNAFVVSGSKSTVASLFYNKQRRSLGVLGYRDVVMFDEVNGAKWSGQEEMIAMLKDFLSTGRFNRDTTEFCSDCSVVFSGNIDCDLEKKEVKGFYRHKFMPFPAIVRDDRAFFDRIHGFIPGWRFSRISEASLAKGHGFMADYFSEIMKKMRQRNYEHVIIDKVKFDTDQRSQAAVTRMGAGLLKLIFPHRTSNTVTTEELELVVAQAVGLRQRVLDQLKVISPGEFGKAKINWSIK